VASIIANVAEAVGGLRYLSGEPGRAPVRAGVSLGDTISGLHAAFGVLAAVRARDGSPSRRGTGEGQLVDVALSESVFNMLESLLPEYAMFGHVRERAGTKLEGIVPTGTYPCSPGPAGEERWIVIGANTDSMFQRLMRTIGRPDLADDPRLHHNDGRVEQEAMLDDVITAWTRTRDPIDALAELEAAEVASGPIQSIADIRQDPQFIAREMFERVALPDGVQLEIPAIVPKLSATPGGTRWIGPELGEHTDAVLRELLGLGDDELAELDEAGVIARLQATSDETDPEPEADPPAP
jgi:formyl-CoA transferase